jgi:alpha-1,2-mannosyltransferase
MLWNHLQTGSRVHTAEPNLEPGSWNPGTVPNQVSTGVNRVGRALTLVAFLFCAGPPVAVGLTGLHVPLPLALLVPVALALAAAGLRGIPALPVALARRHPIAAMVWVLVLFAAAGQIARASAFAYDVTRRECSVAPADRFRSQHNCLTAYAEAARFAAAGGVNVYDSALYRPGAVPRHIGPLTVDPFHYPPPFLLLPAAVRAVAPDFFDTRRVWFGLQVLLLGGVMLAVARWIGGETGRRVALATVAVWALPTTFMALQTGNFQITAIPVAVLGVILAWSARPGLGGGLLAYAAAGKIFPARHGAGAWWVQLRLSASRSPVPRRSRSARIPSSTSCVTSCRGSPAGHRSRKRNSRSRSP